MAFSSEEILDVVDIHNHVVGQLTRGEIHERGLLHRSVHVLLFDSRQRLFVQKRSAFKDTNPGLWDTSAAGHVDAGEVPFSAAKRELQEELGITINASELEPLITLEPDPDTGNEFVSVYRAASDQPLILEEGEIEDGEWLTRHELSEAVSTTPERFTTVFRRILEVVGL